MKVLEPSIARRKRVARALAATGLTLALFHSCANDDTTSSPAPTATGAPALEQPAIWPSADVAFATPEEAARDFVSEVLGVSPVIGEFQQGDSRSGEIEVFSPGEGGGTRVTRGLLLLRQLGPQDGWFVLAAVNDNASITSPETGDEVADGSLDIEGEGRGFEGNVVVSAFVAGDADTTLDEEITQGGSAAEPEPFDVTLDLSDGSPGDIVTLLVRGGTGLETDPGEFGAIPVVIAE